MKTKYKESDMYAPIKNLLTQEGFLVRGEVKGCDIAATKDDALWVVEMKLAPNLTLIYQAMARQMATHQVFVGIPRPKSLKGSYPKLKKLLKQCQLGLILVSLDSPLPLAEIVLMPGEGKAKANKKTAAIKKEMAGRSVDTTGGVSKTKINTAYKERCIHVLCLLYILGQASTKMLVEKGADKTAGHMLRFNAYQWFHRIEKGVYQLSPTGVDYLNQHIHSPLITYYLTGESASTFPAP